MGIVSTHFPELTRFVGRPKIPFSNEQDALLIEQHHKWSVERLIKTLGVTGGTLYRRIHELGLPVREYKRRETSQ
jgi:transcriptional regulator of acetoin/glycerol metabolism